jgi:Cft2 family RNA processing exonuclease
MGRDAIINTSYRIVYISVSLLKLLVLNRFKSNGSHILGVGIVHFTKASVSIVYTVDKSSKTFQSTN